MSLPPSLAFNVKRFQASQTESLRVFSDRTSYTPGSVINFKLPTSGVLDLHTLAALATFKVVHSGAVTLTTQEYNAAGMIQRLDVNIGGTAVGLSALTDFGLAYKLMKKYAERKERTDYRQTVGREGAVTVSAVNGTATFPLYLLGEMPGFLGGEVMRYLPLSLLPQIEINITLKPVLAWTQEDNSAIAAGSITLESPQLLFQRVTYENSLLEQLYANRISEAPLVVPFTNMSIYESSTLTTSGTLTASIAAQSIDYILGTSRPSTYGSTYSNVLKTWVDSASTATATYQMFVAGNPVSSFPLTPIQCVWNNCAALEGGNNVLYAPDITSYTTFNSTDFALVHRFKHATEESDGKGWITGMSTFGAQMPIDLTLTGADAGNSSRLVMLIFHTSTLEIGAGRQISLVN